MPATPDFAAIARTTRWLASVLDITAMPEGFTVAVFHESPAPIEHFTLAGQPIRESTEAVGAVVQWTILSHALDHFLEDATDEQFTAACDRAEEPSRIEALCLRRSAAQGAVLTGGSDG